MKAEHKKTYEHLFFDLDHTLWDFDANSKATLQYLYQRFGLEQLQVGECETFVLHYEKHNDFLWTKLRNGTISRAELRWKRMAMTLEEFGIIDQKLAKEMSVVYLEKLPQQNQLIDGTLELLEYCKEKKYHLHIITNGFKSTQLEKLNTSGIASYFENVFTSENTQTMKPHRPIFEQALRFTGATLDNSIMIGDSIDADITGAINMGIDQIFYNPHKQEHSLNVTFEVQKLQEMMSLL
jgi:putative hydrolase of the HAD superfamily